MSDKQAIARTPPMEASGLTPEWAARVKYALAQPGNSAEPLGLSIHCKTRLNPTGGPLLLPNCGTEFASAKDLAIALDMLNIYQP